jgi:transposase
MAKALVTNELWEVIEALLPQEPPKPKGGRPRIPDRAALMGILFVLKSGIPWEMLPQEMDCGSAMTCWRRLEEWHEAGVWERLHRMLLDRLGQADEIDWARASLDSASVAAPGGPKDRPEPNRSRQTGLQAPCCGRSKGGPPRGGPDCRQRP